MLQYRESVESPPPSFEGRLRDFFVIRGFREIPTDIEGRMRFRRGESSRSWFALDPARWPLEIDLDTRAGELRMEVHSGGQFVTPGERRYFDLLFEETLQSFRGRNYAVRSEEASRAALNENVTVTAAMLMLLPLTVMILHSALAMPIVWSIGWGSAGAMAAGYALLFNIRNRIESSPEPLREP